MKINYLQTKASLLLLSLGMVLSLQSCNKEADSLAPAVGAASADAVYTGTVPAPCKTVDLVAGQHTSVGNVGVAMVPGGIVVTYTITSPGIYLLETHMDAFSSTDQLKADKKISGGGAIPGKFAFKNSWDSATQKTTYSEFIPNSYLTSKGLTNNCFFIGTHAALSNGETAWGGLSRPTSTGVSLDVAKQFPGNNWSVYFEFCTDECSSTKDFTYAWEDGRNNGNDGDYNDLVIQSHLIKSPGELKIQFLATAKGALFDHKFRFKIPKAGINGVFGAPSYTSDATYYYITVFESTAAALPASPGSNPNFAANTTPSQTACTPFAAKEITLTLNNSFTYNQNRPFEPYITVFYLFDSALTPGAPSYDLYIHEVSNRDTWTNDGTHFFPNGILIPFDWRWPLERVEITRPYPNFVFDPTTGLAPNWANTLADPSLTFDKAICN